MQEIAWAKRAIFFKWNLGVYSFDFWTKLWRFSAKGISEWDNPPFPHPSTNLPNAEDRARIRDKGGKFSFVEGITIVIQK